MKLRAVRLVMILCVLSLVLSGCALLPDPVPLRTEEASAGEDSGGTASGTDSGGSNTGTDASGTDNANADADISGADMASPGLPERSAPRVPENSVLTAPRSEETASGDRVLASMQIEPEGGPLLRLDAIGQTPEEGGPEYGLREVRVFADGELLQIITPRIGEEEQETREGEEAAEPYYSRASSIEEAAALRDVNFDGLPDLDMGDRLADDTLSHDYWMWDAGGYRFQYAFTLQNVTLDPAAKELLSTYRYSSYVTFSDAYRFNEAGELTLVRRRAEDWRHGSEDFPLVAYYEYPNGERTLIRQEYTNYDEQGKVIREVRSMVNGTMTPVLLEELEVIDGEIRVLRTEEIPLPEPETDTESQEPVQEEEPERPRLSADEVPEGTDVW